MQYENWKKGDPILYKRDKADDFSFVPPKGRYFDDLVPDTVDLSEMARLSINAMTRATDPDADYEIYFWMLLDGTIPYMRHDMADMCIMKFQEGLPLMRLICGSRQNEEIESKWMETTLKSIGEDGHLYECLMGRPWWREGCGIPISSDDSIPEEMCFVVDPAYSGRFLSAMTIYYKRSGDEVWKNAALRLVDALSDCAIHKDHYAYFSPSPYIAKKDSVEDYGRQEPLVGSEVRHPLLGCLHVYREFAYEPARKLAEKLLAYLLLELHAIGDDGEFLCHANFVKESRCFEFMGTEAHFHAHTSILHYTLEYALITGDHGNIEKILRGYDYAKTHGQAQLGFFGEYVKSVEYEQHETCELADMVAIAVKLSEAGIRDCYDDIDLWLRNMGAESQLTPDKAVALLKYAQTMPYDSPKSDNYGYDDAIGRNVGGFAGWAKPNNFFDPIEKHVIMHCCTGNMTRAIYYAWKSAVRVTGERVEINLLMNLETPAASVVSYIPYSGKADITLHKDCTLRIRVPGWGAAECGTITINGVVSEVLLDGKYYFLSERKAGDVIIVDLPIVETSKYIWVEKERYYITMRGHDVVDILPKGNSCPLFNRGRYSSGEISYRKVTRFITSEDIDW